MTAYERVLAEPSSLAAREALAREWRANGDPRAELVELQLRYRQHRIDNTVWTDEANALLRAAYKLVSTHGKAWAGEIARLVTKYEFHRGCIAEVTLPGASFASVMPKLIALAPIQHVNLIAPLEVQTVFGSPLFERVTSLKAVTLGAAFGDREAVELAASPHVRNLVWVRLTDNAIGDVGVEALAASPHLAACAYVDLQGNPVDPTPQISELDGTRVAVRSSRAGELERAHGRRPWLELPTNVTTWPADRDDMSTR